MLIIYSAFEVDIVACSFRLIDLAFTSRCVYLLADSSGKVYFVDVIYALLRTADKNTSASGHYTYFSMQQKHDFLLSLSRIYKKKVVKSLKKNLQHEHFKVCSLCIACCIPRVLD